jgi:hypothetical protein
MYLPINIANNNNITYIQGLIVEIHQKIVVYLTSSCVNWAFFSMSRPV